jgi:hypothetical protein
LIRSDFIFVVKPCLNFSLRKYTVFLTWGDFDSLWKQDIVIQHVTSADGSHTDFFLKMTYTGTSHNKGKAVPLQAWNGPEGSRNLRFPDFMTTAQDGGKVVSLTHRPPLPPGNTPGTHFC